MADHELSYDEIMNIIEERDREEEKDRRKKKDWITKVPVAVSLFAWCILTATWVVFDYYNPFKRTMSRVFASTPKGLSAEQAASVTAWRGVPVNIMYIMLMSAIGLCVVAFFVNRLRMRRKTDKYRKTVFFVGGVSIIAFIVFLIYFVPMNIIGNWS
ncbi:MAG: hypothetical protein FWH17_08135 [Oscillospiraceae bacterium]|nr:hypothetical protein [Oscillospiraceae bacterium]